MLTHLRKHLFTLIILSIALSSCAVESQPQLVVPTMEEKAPQIPTVTPTLEPPVTMLSICVGEEPTSLFLYGDVSPTAKAIRQAIYDGPVDVLNFNPSPVILTQIPSQANGAVTLLPVDVHPGTEIVDINGNLTYLTPGIVYRPAGCSTPECGEIYPGDGIVKVDQVVVRFELLENLRWSDGIPLTANDSIFSYQVTTDIFSQYPPDILRFTQAYWAIDERQIEWRGVPGYQGIASYADLFFTPLPQHAWGTLTLQELFTSPATAQKPLGWGAYILDEWIAGDHISLSKNPYYFRATENFPYFDHISFRFVADAEDAVTAFQGGECDVVANVNGLVNELSTLQALELAGELRVIFQENLAWEQAAFGISSLDPETANLFQEPRTRQAIAMCIDREAVAASVGYAGSVANSYLPQAHPLNNLGERYAFAPQDAADLLDEIGWMDHDQDAETARQSSGVPGVEDGTSLGFVYRVVGERVPEGGPQGVPREAEIIQESLAQCGVEVTFLAQSAEDLFAPGPEGVVFGRQFEMAQFAWSFGKESLCKLFMSSEIPGIYPDYPKGWGGGNAPGYSIFSKLD